MLISPDHWAKLLFSNKEKQRIQEILEELKEIFAGQRVDIHGEVNENFLINYHIDIVDCPDRCKESRLC